MGRMMQSNGPASKNTEKTKIRGSVKRSTLGRESDDSPPAGCRSAAMEKEAFRESTDGYYFVISRQAVIAIVGMATL